MRCYRCMKEFKDGYEICPHCGYDMGSQPDFLYYLSPGIVLQNRYHVGVVIGFGGFGILYKAWDEQLKTVTAIKEYYPIRLAERIPDSREVTVYAGRSMQEYEAGLERFLEEARNICKFSSHRNVVNAYNFFKENGTAYIVMEYLDGLTLRSFLKANGEKISLAYAKEIILSVANALQALHKEQIIHRDISPDNIFLLSDGRIKLIDFGAARLSVDEKERRPIELKPGYAPPEQYQVAGEQGPWTDVYGLGATMYRAITGSVPTESVRREQEDTLQPPCELVEGLPEYIDTAIMRSMELDIHNRFSSVDGFVDVLTKKKKVLPLHEEIRRRKKRRRYSFLISLTLLLIAGGIVGVQMYEAVCGTSVSTPLEIWICAKEGENAEALQEYYKTVSNEVFGEDYPNVPLEIEVIPQEEYESRLLDAVKKGEAPEIFESTQLGGTALEHGVELDDLVNRLADQSGKEWESYYFLSDYRSYISEGKRLPVGFALPVVFSVQPEYSALVKENKIADSMAQLSADGEDQELIQQFSEGAYTYLLGNSTDYDTIQEQVYGTYDEPNKRIRGKLAVSGIEGKKPEFTTTFSVSEYCTQKEKRAAYLYLQYMLSYQEQYLLHACGRKEGVLESTAFSVNVRADEEYRRTRKRVFSVLDAVIGNY